MKINLKNLKFKEMFVNHVEKIVLGLAVVSLLLFVLSAVQREKLPSDQEPDNLKSKAQLAQQHIANSVVPPDELRPKDAPKYIDRIKREPVQLSYYDQTQPFNSPIIDSKTPRDEPIYLTAAEIRANAGFAPFVTIDRSAAEDGVPPNIRRPLRPGEEEEVVEEEKVRVVDRAQRGGAKVSPNDKLVVKYWAITALIPVRAQKAEYLKVFEQAVDYQPERDVPAYLGYYIERAEVVSGDMQNLKWERVPAERDFMELWAETMPEPVDPQYLTSIFVTPLGPRYGMAWEDYVGHAPEIPLVSTTNELGRGMRGEGIGGRMPGGNRVMGGARPRGFDDEDGGRRPVAPGGNIGMPEDEADAFQKGVRKNEEVVEDTTSQEEMLRMNETVAMTRENQEDRPVKGLDNLLFRFCDFSVQPGKQYVYRVQLGVSNPNRELPVKYLKRPELADTKPRMSDWSQPSAVVTIPFGDKLMTGPVTPPTATKEPTARVRIVQIKNEIGLEIPMEADIPRGRVANFVNKKTEYISPEGTVKEYTTDFTTNAMLLDLRGGRQVLRDKTVTEPGEVLILSRSGQIMAMNEFDDEEVWSNYAVPPVEETPKAGPGREDDLEGDRPLPGRGRKPPRSAPDPLGNLGGSRKSARAAVR